MYNKNLFCPRAFFHFTFHCISYCRVAAGLFFCDLPPRSGGFPRFLEVIFALGGAIMHSTLLYSTPKLTGIRYLGRKRRGNLRGPGSPPRISGERKLARWGIAAEDFRGEDEFESDFFRRRLRRRLRRTTYPHYGPTQSGAKLSANQRSGRGPKSEDFGTCLLYTSDAADE